MKATPSAGEFIGPISAVLCAKNRTVSASIAAQTNKGECVAFDVLQKVWQLFHLQKKNSPGPHEVLHAKDLGLRDLDEEDIPRYPPFAKGLPVAPMDKLMLTQASLIEKIRAALGMKKSDFDVLVYPVLERYGAFVHLLPASEAHHHRGAGGLFRHGLEVAFWATQASDAVIFSMEGSPLERRNNEPRWRLASCFAGLLHDVGKPLSDVSVSDRDGRVTWNPYGETLFDWASRHKVQRYFLRWRDSRHKRHEKFSLLTVDRLLPQATREYLSDAGPAVIESMLEAISGVGANQPITKLMLMADRESVSRDMKENRLNVDEFSYGVPVERYLFDAMRRLVKSGRWQVNVAGGKIWLLEQGIFVIWRPVQDIIDLLAKDKTPGIPRDSDTLADILIERGFAHSCSVSEDGKSAQYRYWKVLPDLLKAEGVTEHLLMLRLDSADLVITGQQPALVKGHVVGLDGLDESQEPQGQEQAVQMEAPEAADHVDHVQAPKETTTAAQVVSEAAKPQKNTEHAKQEGPAKPEDGAEETAEDAIAACLSGIGLPDSLEMFGLGLDTSAGAGAPDTDDPPTQPQVTGEPQAQEVKAVAPAPALAADTKPVVTKKSSPTPAKEDALPVKQASTKTPAEKSKRTTKWLTKKEAKQAFVEQSGCGFLQEMLVQDDTGVQEEERQPDLAVNFLNDIATHQEPLPAVQGEGLPDFLFHQPAQPSQPLEPAAQAQAKPKQKRSASKKKAPASELDEPVAQPPKKRTEEAKPKPDPKPKPQVKAVESVAIETTEADQITLEPECVLDELLGMDVGLGCGPQPVVTFVEQPKQSLKVEQAHLMEDIPNQPFDDFKEYQSLPEIGKKLLSKVFTPILNQEKTLGEEIYFVKQDLCLRHDVIESVLLNGDEAIEELIKHGIFNKNKKNHIWSFDDVQVLMFSNLISAMARKIFGLEAQGIEEDYSNQAPMARMLPERENHKAEEKTESTVEPVSPSAIESEGRAQIMIVDDLAAAEEDSQQSNEQIARRLREMIISGNGRWLASPVQKDSSGIFITRDSLKLIKTDFPLFNDAAFFFEALSSKKMNLKITKDKIYIKE